MENRVRDTALTLLAQDVAAAIDYLSGQPTAEAEITAEVVVDCYLALQKHLYYTDKDMANLIFISAAGVQFALAEAHRTPENAYLMRSKAKALFYNLASYTWPGWDEPGLLLDSTQLAMGYSAAKANLRLAHELDKGDLALARAHWIVGAHQLAMTHWTAAMASFTVAVHFAQEADSAPDALLAQGYMALTDILRQPANADAKERLGDLKAQLAQLEYGSFFIQQLDTALAVFQAEQKS